MSVATTASTDLTNTTRHLLVGTDACATQEQPCPPADTFRCAAPLSVDIQPPRTEPLEEDLLLGADPDR